MSTPPTGRSHKQNVNPFHRKVTQTKCKRLPQEGHTSNCFFVSQHLAFLDLAYLSGHSYQRRQEVYSLSQPGGHPHTWRAVCTACLQQLEALATQVNTAHLAALATLPVQHLPADKIFSSMGTLVCPAWCSFSHTGQRHSPGHPAFRAPACWQHGYINVSGLVLSMALLPVLLRNHGCQYSLHQKWWWKWHVWKAVFWPGACGFEIQRVSWCEECACGSGIQRLRWCEEGGAVCFQVFVDPDSKGCIFYPLFWQWSFSMLAGVYCVGFGLCWYSVCLWQDLVPVGTGVMTCACDRIWSLLVQVWWLVCLWHRIWSLLVQVWWLVCLWHRIWSLLVQVWWRVLVTQDLVPVGTGVITCVLVTGFGPCWYRCDNLCACDRIWSLLVQVWWRVLVTGFGPCWYRCDDLCACDTGFGPCWYRCDDLCACDTGFGPCWYRCDDLCACDTGFGPCWYRCDDVCLWHRICPCWYRCDDVCLWQDLVPVGTGVMTCACDIGFGPCWYRCDDVCLWHRIWSLLVQVWWRVLVTQDLVPVGTGVMTCACDTGFGPCWYRCDDVCLWQDLVPVGTGVMTCACDIGFGPCWYRCDDVCLWHRIWSLLVQVWWLVCLWHRIWSLLVQVWWRVLVT